jgi:hypothetical protein
MKVEYSLLRRRPDSTRTVAVENGQQVLPDAAPNPVQPGAQYAQAALGFCAVGPVGCAAGATITGGQMLLGGAIHFVREQAYEGKHVIQTEEPSLSAVEAVRLYKELSEVERAFANLKDVIDLRPIYRRTDDRVQVHIFVAALAHVVTNRHSPSRKIKGLNGQMRQMPNVPNVKHEPCPRNEKSENWGAG